jgi:phosphoribosylanthranilate isomerase
VPDAPLVKVCGLTDPAEAAACAAHGAWAIGVVFAPESVRVVSVDRAREVLSALPAEVRRVGVFVDAGLDALTEVARACDLTHVQLHGDVVDIAGARAVTGCEVIRGFAVDGPAALDAARACDADLVLLDAAVAGRHGGTGRAFDWSLLEGADLGRPYLLAGGLDAANVGEAVRRLRPAMVDVSSGVEWAPGRKDPERVRAFIEAARAPARVGTA